MARAPKTRESLVEDYVPGPPSLGSLGTSSILSVPAEDVDGSPLGAVRPWSESSSSDADSELEARKNPFPHWLEDGNIPTQQLIAAQNSKMSRLPTEAQADFACRLWWEKQCFSFKLHREIQPGIPLSMEPHTSHEMRPSSRPFVLEEGSNMRKVPRKIRGSRAQTAMGTRNQTDAALDDPQLLLRSGRKLWKDHNDLEGAESMLTKALLSENLDFHLKMEIEQMLAEIRHVSRDIPTAAGNAPEAQGQRLFPQWRTRWSPEFKASGVVVGEYGVVAAVEDAEHFGTVRAIDPIPQGGKTYFECRIELQSKRQGESLGGGYLIGVCSREFREFERIPGRAGRFSKAMWALQDKNNSARGAVLNGGQAKDWILGSAFGNLDAIGVLVDMERKSVTFYKNGVRCGEEACAGIPSEVFPMCTLINSRATARISCPGSLPEFLYPMKTAWATRQGAKQQSRAAIVLKEHVVGRPLGWAAKQQTTPQMLSKVLQSLSMLEVLRSPVFTPKQTPKTADPEPASRSSSPLSRSAHHLVRTASRSAPPGSLSNSLLSTTEAPAGGFSLRALQEESALARSLQQRQSAFLSKLHKETTISLRIGPKGFRDREKPTWADSLRLS